MKRLFFVFSICMLTLTASATIRVVSRDADSPFQTIQSAINASSAGDTVIVRGDQGTWSENDTVSVRVVLIGFGNGCYSVPATYVNGQFRFKWGSSGSVVEGFWVNAPAINGGAIQVDNNVTGITTRRCRLYGYWSLGFGSPNCINAGTQASFTAEECILATNNNNDIYVGSGSQAAIRNCVFLSTAIISCGGSYSASVTTQNCVFLAGSGAVFAGSANWSIDHCIFWGATWNGSFSNSNVTASYNAITASMTQFPGSNNIVITTNPFVNYSGSYVYCTSDLHPTTASGLIDAGDPNAPDDRDGTRRDLGIYGGLYPYVDTGAPDFPLVINFFASPSVPQNGLLEIRSTGRVGPGEGQ